MKSYTIDTAAAWVGTIQTWQDGDVFRESNLDLMADSIADRLGYLKTKADGAAYLAAASQTFTGLQTISGVAGGVNITGDVGLSVTQTASFLSDIDVTGTAICNVVAAQTELRLPIATLPDANATISCFGRNRVPQLTANRSYTLPGGGVATLAVISVSAAGWVEFQDSNGNCLRVTRSRTADAFTVTILGTAGSGANQWRVTAWGGTVTSLDTTA
mgnify:CR=1 FL=1